MVKSKKNSYISAAEGGVEKEMAPPSQQFGTAGTVLEAAFVDPSYQWPPPDGVGKNAIELQASVNLVLDDDASVKTTDSQRERMHIPDNPASSNKYDSSGGRKKKWWNCCSVAPGVILPFLI